MRILGLDYGDRTVGVALSDPTLSIASPMETVFRDTPEGLKQTIRRLREIVNEYGVETIVLGLPRNMNGSEGLRAEKTRAFQKRLLRDIYRVEVVFWDERLSTRTAEAPLLAMKQDRFQRKEKVDAMAAAVILQGYLDHMQNTSDKKEGPVMDETNSQITLYEPTEQLKSVMDVFETLELEGRTYFLAAVNMGEPDPEEDDPEEEDGVFIFRYCDEAEAEFLVLNEDGTTKTYVTTGMEEEEEAAVIEAFQNLDGDYDLLLDEE